MSWSSDYTLGTFSCDTNRTYFPKDFRDEILSLEDRHGSVCKEMQSGYSHPDYSVLRGPQLDFYFFWRDNVRAGKLLTADSGFAWLYVTELINSGRRKEDVFDDVLQFTETCSNSLRLAPMVRSLPESFAIALDLPLDLVPRRRPLKPSLILFTWDMTRYPIKRPDSDIVLDGAVYKKASKLGIKDKDLAEIIYLSYTGIDEITRSSKGKALLDDIGCYFEAESVSPFDGFADYSGKGRRKIMPIVRIDEGPLRDLTDSIMKTAISLMTKQKTSIPRSFPLQYRDVVSAAVRKVIDGGRWDVSSFRSPGLDGSDFWEDFEPELDLSVKDLGPRLLPFPYPETSTPPIDRRTLDSHWSDAGEPSEYVPSGRLMTSYATMDESQLAFYLGWRTAARKGRYEDTDAGYMWLYCTELINHDDDPSGVQSELERALEAFSGCFPKPQALCTAAADHALFHGLDTHPDSQDARYDRYFVYCKLSSEPVGRMGMAQGMQFSSLDTDRYTHADSRLYQVAFTNSVRAVDKYLKTAKGKRIAELGGTYEMIFTKRFYQGLWYPQNPIKKVEFEDVISSDRICALMDGILRLTIYTINKSLKLPLPKTRTDMSADITKIVQSETAKVIGSSSREKTPPPETGIVLDSEAIRSASEDLDAVRGMMSVEYEEDEKAEPGEAPSVENRGWAALLSLLDNTELAYLEAALEGDALETLRKAGRRQVEIEDSINSKAADTVGDVVVEDGRIFEDYVKNITEALK